MGDNKRLRKLAIEVTNAATETARRTIGAPTTADANARNGLPDKVGPNVGSTFEGAAQNIAQHMGEGGRATRQANEVPGTQSTASGEVNAPQSTAPDDVAATPDDIIEVTDTKTVADSGEAVDDLTRRVADGTATIRRIGANNPNLTLENQIISEKPGSRNSVAENLDDVGTMPPEGVVPDKNIQQSPVDFDHVLKADYKKNGKPTGGHTLLYGDVRIVPGTESVPDVAGVYNATVQVPDPANPGQWITKTSNNSTNTMFPKDWDEDRVKTEVNAAWNDPNKTIQGDKWISVTPSGVKVEGWISPRTTVYPVYQAPTKP